MRKTVRRTKQQAIKVATDRLDAGHSDVVVRHVRGAWLK